MRSNPCRVCRRCLVRRITTVTVLLLSECLFMTQTSQSHRLTIDCALWQVDYLVQVLCKCRVAVQCAGSAGPRAWGTLTVLHRNAIGVHGSGCRPPALRYDILSESITLSYPSLVWRAYFDRGGWGTCIPITGFARTYYAPPQPSQPEPRSYSRMS